MVNNRATEYRYDILIASCSISHICNAMHLWFLF